MTEIALVLIVALLALLIITVGRLIVQVDDLHKSVDIGAARLRYAIREKPPEDPFKPLFHCKYEPVDVAEALDHHSARERALKMSMRIAQELAANEKEDDAAL